MKFIPYGKHSIDKEDIEAVVDILRSDRLTQGPKVAEFEAALAAHGGARYATVFSSGTAALHAAYTIGGLTPGSEIITSPVTFVATANAALYLGAKPIFADIEPDTANLDASRIESLITDRTRLIVPVHFAGQPCALDEIHRIARRHNLCVIEDACHALGATYRDRRIGGLSDMTVFSFHPVKHIATGEGGAVLTDNPAFHRRLQMFREHGITRDPALLTAGLSTGIDPGHPDLDPDPNTGTSPDTTETPSAPWHYEMQQLGYNYRLTELQCALGINQLKKLDQFLKRRREIAAAYDQAFAAMPGLHPLTQRPDRQSAYHLYVVQVDWERIGRSRHQIYARLQQSGIGTQVHYLPVYRQPYYQNLGYPPGLCPRAENYYANALTLPLFPAMTTEEVDRVIEAISNVLG